MALYAYVRDNPRTLDEVKRDLSFLLKLLRGLPLLQDLLAGIPPNVTVLGKRAHNVDKGITMVPKGVKKSPQFVFTLEE
jgi:hypothetical protein